MSPTSQPPAPAPSDPAAPSPAAATMRRSAPRLAAALALLLGCGAPEPASPVAASTAALDAERSVQLVYARAVTGAACAGCVTWSGVAELRNLSASKAVSVRADRPGTPGTHTSRASYLHTLPSGNEIWRFTGVPGLTPDGQPGQALLDVQYSGRYLDVDDNGGARYRARTALVSGLGVVGVEAPLHRSLDVAVTEARVNDGSPAAELEISLLVRNRTYHKVVRAVYSTDAWTTVREAFGTYQYGDGPGGETWLVRERLPAGAFRVAFAVSAEQGGDTAWDNDYGRDYYCRYEAERGAWRCSGYTLPD